VIPKRLVWYKGLKLKGFHILVDKSLLLITAISLFSQQINQKQSRRSSIFQNKTLLHHAYLPVCNTMCNSLLFTSSQWRSEQWAINGFTFHIQHFCHVVQWQCKLYQLYQCGTDLHYGQNVSHLDLILSKDRYSPIPWSKICTKLVRECFLWGEEQPDRELTLCTHCLAHNPAFYCNAMYNCGFRRTLTVEQPQEQQHHCEGQELTKLMTMEMTSTATATGVASKIQTQFTLVWMAQLIKLSSNVMLQNLCCQAMASCVCQATIS